VPPQALYALQGTAVDGGSSYYDSSGVRKAVLLARYTDILHDWSVLHDCAMISCRVLLHGCTQASQ
jgi:hypothetical protein